MIPAPFEYLRVSTVDEAVAALAHYGDEAKVLAGGHSLVPLMKLRLATPEVIVDVGGIAGLSAIEVQGDEVVIGALARHAAVASSEVLRGSCPLVADVAATIGDPQVRNRGTFGGSLAHADPASDLPAAVLALGATLVAVGPGGRREIPVSDFFLGFLESALAPDELLVEVRLPVHRGGWSFQKFTRRAQDWAIVAVAAVVGERVGVGLVNMGSVPLRATATEAALAAGAGIEAAAEVADEGTDPPDDLGGSAEYRRHLARVLTFRALADAERR